jgi:hypothetical protein
MKCPHCGYEHRWSGEELKTIEGEFGDFYESSITLVRSSYAYTGYYKEGVLLCACPSCKKTFVD